MNARFRPGSTLSLVFLLFGMVMFVPGSAFGQSGAATWEDLAGTVQIRQTAGRIDRVARDYASQASVTNASGGALEGEIRLVIESSNKTPKDADGTTTAGEPYYLLQGDGSALAVGAALVRAIHFDYSRGRLLYTVRAERLAVPSQIEVPNVIGQARATAEGNITAAGLSVGNVAEQNSDTVAAGNVISQAPAAGSTVDTGSAVDLVVSLGPVQVNVPNVIGQARATAEGNITAAGLSVGNVTEQNSDTVAAGNVISQAPAAGSTVDTGSAVNLVVSLGPVQVDVPNVIGQARATAEGNITAAGLSVGNVTEQNSDTVAAGNVISQDPAAGSTVDTGSAVDLVVSLGPVQVDVPNVIGQARATAEGNITAAGLSVGNVTEQNSDTVAAGNVISQAPAAGSTVDTGSAVNLVVSLGPVQVNVPDFVGQARATAEGNITAAGLSVGNVTEQNSDTVAAGNVISQDPAAGSAVDTGSAVDLVVSLGPAELTATLTGLVTDLDGNPLSDVTVKIGQATVFVQTDTNGQYIADIGPDEVNADGQAVVTVAPAGYTSNQVKANVQLLAEPEVYNADVQVKPVTTQQQEPNPDTAAIEIVAEESGQPKAEVMIPAGAIVDDEGNAVDEPVTVEVTPVDPGSEEIDAFPGTDFIALVPPGEGQGDSRDEVLLESVALVEVRITGDDTGNQYEDLDTPATIELRIPDDQQDQVTVGEEIELWHYDDEAGVWIQEGVATIFEKEVPPGSGIFEKWASAEVNHFTWWNVDRPVSDHTCWRGRLVRKGTGEVIPNVNLKADGVTYNGQSYGDSDGEGNVCVSVKRSSTTTEQVTFFITYGGGNQYLVRQQDGSFSLTPEKAQATVFDNSNVQKSCFNTADRPFCDLVSPTAVSGFLVGDVVIDMNRVPLVELSVPRESVRTGTTIEIVGNVTDPDGDVVTDCSWTGTGLSSIDDDPTAPFAHWTAPEIDPSPYVVSLACTDEYGAVGTASISLYSVENNAPDVTGVTTIPDFATGVVPGGVSTWSAVCEDADGDDIAGFEWRHIYGATGTITPGDEAGPSGTIGTAAWIAEGTNGTKYHQVRCQDSNNAWGPWTQFTDRVVNQAPIIDSLIATPDSVGPGDSTTVTVSAYDPDGHDPLSYRWYSYYGNVSGSGTSVTFTPSYPSGAGWIYVTVADRFGQARTQYLYVTVDNTAPTVSWIDCTGNDGPGDVRNCTAVASDPDTGDTVVEYQWSVSNGTIGTSTGATNTWTLPSAGDSRLYARAKDNHGAWGRWNSVKVTVDNRPPVISDLECTGAVRPFSVRDCIATASDPDDGDTVASLQWRAYYGGSVGALTTTAPENTWTLSNGGTDALYVRATDSYGAVGNWASLWVSVENEAPEISALSADPTSFNAGETTRLTATVNDADGDAFDCFWSDNTGGFFSNQSAAADTCETDYSVASGSTHTPCLQVREDFGNGNTGLWSDQVCVNVEVNNGPIVTLFADPQQVALEGTSSLTTSITDPEGDELDQGTVSWTASCGDTTLSSTDASGATFTAPAGFSGACTVTMTVADVDGASGSGDIRLNVGDQFVPSENLVFTVLDQCGRPLEGANVWLHNVYWGDGEGGSTGDLVLDTTDEDGISDWGNWGDTNPIDFSVGWEFYNEWNGRDERHVQEFRGVTPGSITVIMPNEPVYNYNSYWSYPRLVCGGDSPEGILNVAVSGGTAGYYPGFEPDLDWYGGNLEVEPKTFAFWVYENSLDRNGLLSLIAFEYEYDSETFQYETAYGFVVDIEPTAWPLDGAGPVIPISLNANAPRLPISVTDGSSWEYDGLQLRARRNFRDYTLGVSSYGSETIDAMTGFPGDALLSYAERGGYYGGGYNSDFAIGPSLIGIGGDEIQYSFVADTLASTPNTTDGIVLTFATAWPSLVNGGLDPAMIEYDLDDVDEETDLFRVTWRGYSEDGYPTLWTVFTSGDSGTNAEYLTETAPVPPELDDWELATTLGTCGGYDDDDDDYDGVGTGYGDVEVAALAVEPADGIADVWALLQTSYLRGNTDLLTDPGTSGDYGGRFLALPTATYVRGNSVGFCDRPSLSLQGKVYDWDPSAGSGGAFTLVSNAQVEVYDAGQCDYGDSTSTDGDGSYELTDVAFGGGGCNNGGFLLTAYDPSDDGRLGVRRDYGFSDGELLNVDIYGGLNDVATDKDEDNDDRTSAAPLTLPAHASYADGENSDKDYFSVEIDAGEVIEVRVYGDPTNQNGGWFSLLDGEGIEIERRCFRPAGPVTDWRDPGCAFGDDGEFAIRYTSSTSQTLYVYIDTVDDENALPNSQTTGGYVIETSIGYEVPGTASIFAVADSTDGAGSGATAAPWIPVVAETSYFIVASGEIGCCGDDSESGGPEGNVVPWSVTVAPDPAINGIAGIGGNRFLPLLGVWGDDGNPRGSTAPTSLSDFDAESGGQVAPAADLWQVFYIGSGPMLATAPTGATRLYLGFIDHGPNGAAVPCCYGDNPGLFEVQVESTAVSP